MHLNRSLLCLVSLFSLLSGTVPRDTHQESAIPVVVVVNPTSVNAGDTVIVHVEMDQTADEDQDVSISASNGSAFSYLPHTITVEEGESSASFEATLSSTASGTTTVSASSAGETATSSPTTIN